MKLLRALGALAGMGARRRFEVGLPRFLTYIVSFTCNARCIMCDSWKKPSPEDLTLEEIEAIFRQLPALDLVRLSGGEPFVLQLGSRPHFITYDGRTSDVSKARTLDYVFIQSRQARLAYAATVVPAMDSDRLADRFSDHLAVQMDLRLEFVPLTAQLPALDAGLAGGKQPF
jgi:hypothetical protein